MPPDAGRGLSHPGAARRLLEDTAQPLQRIATNCGFADMNTMRRIFAKTIGVTPAAYRSRFHPGLHVVSAVMSPGHRGTPVAEGATGRGMA